MRKGIVLLLMLVAPAASAGKDTLLFQSDEPLRAALTAPLSQAYEQKGQEQRLYLDGQWSYRDGEETVRLPVKVRARGNFRRRVCSQPPLLLNFPKKQLDDTLLDGQNKLKMVSPCKDDDKYQQLVHLEYLIYRLYALYSDHHFRVRPVEVGYVDTDGQLSPWQSTNFLIEDKSDMAARAGWVAHELPTAWRKQLDLGATALLEIFQFMVGNVDYSTLKARPGDDCCHNVRLIGPEGAEAGLVPVPYDFDSTGLVNAPYAEWPDAIPIKKITQRYFTGWCKEETRYREAIARINARRDEAIALFEQSPDLDKYYRKRAVDYLEKSYKYINDEGYLKRYILERCRGEVIEG